MLCKIDDTIKVPGPFSSQNLNQMTLFIFLYDSRKKRYSDISGKNNIQIFQEISEIKFLVSM